MSLYWNGQNGTFTFTEHLEFFTYIKLVLKLTRVNYWKENNQYYWIKLLQK